MYSTTLCNYLILPHGQYEGIRVCIKRYKSALMGFFVVIPS